MSGLELLAVEVSTRSVIAPSPTTVPTPAERGAP